jgi:hypothetical protein
MKNLNYLNKYRVEHPAGKGDEHNGIFKIYVGCRSFFVIASDGGGWDHVSVSPRNAKKCPTWEEMCSIKDMFFDSKETVLEYHPAKFNYINNYQYCLHLWRPQTENIPIPPKWMV